MLERLQQDLRNESYEIYSPVTGESAMVVDIQDVDSKIKKHNYLTLGGLLATVAPHQLVAIKAGTTVNQFEFLGTAKLALEGGIPDAFKNISCQPFEMNVAIVDVRTGYLEYNDPDDNHIDAPVLFILVN